MAPTPKKHYHLPAYFFADVVWGGGGGGCPHKVISPGNWNRISYFLVHLGSRPRHTYFESAGIKPNRAEWKNFQNSRLIREGISIEPKILTGLLECASNLPRIILAHSGCTSFRMQLECSWNTVGIEDELGTFWHYLK